MRVRDFEQRSSENLFGVQRGCRSLSLPNILFLNDKPLIPLCTVRCLVAMPICVILNCLAQVWIGSRFKSSDSRTISPWASWALSSTIYLLNVRSKNNIASASIEIVISFRYNWIHRSCYWCRQRRSYWCAMSHIEGQINLKAVTASWICGIFGWLLTS